MSPNQDQVIKEILDKIKAAAKKGGSRKSQPALTSKMYQPGEAFITVADGKKIDITRREITPENEAEIATRLRQIIQQKSKVGKLKEGGKFLKDLYREQKEDKQEFNWRDALDVTSQVREAARDAGEDAEGRGPERTDADEGAEGAEKQKPGEPETGAETEQPEQQPGTEAEGEKKEKEAKEKETEETQPEQKPPAAVPQPPEGEKKDELKPGGEQKAARELAAAKNRERKPAEEEKKKKEEDEEKKKKPSFIGLAQVAAQQSTGRLLQLAWLNVIDSVGLTLIYINFHFIMYAFGPSEWFAKPGSEWTAILGKGSKAGGGAATDTADKAKDKKTEEASDKAANVMEFGNFLLYYVELIVLIVLDLIVAFLAALIIIIIYITISMFFNPLGAASDFAQTFGSEFYTWFKSIM